ncbi:transposase [Corynebacterium alimapuense]|uniref:Transposase n=1 Tax=Corynebacterium alimapuense TaxID=1576874 RepID=A0A3M8K4D9_9CORY|nr:transposase [Corynebacterium alimapuense]RNE48061.1 hypothetical protein C5L39_10515 [Corynebacterium alimapuense]
MTKLRKYTPEYRREAAQRVITSGQTSAAVERELGISPGLLSRWVKAERQRPDRPLPAKKPAQKPTAKELPTTTPLPSAVDAVAALNAHERAELASLRQENDRLKTDNDFLEKAATFFAAKHHH